MSECLSAEGYDIAWRSHGTVYADFLCLIVCPYLRNWTVVVVVSDSGQAKSTPKQNYLGGLWQFNGVYGSTGSVRLTEDNPIRIHISNN